MTNDHLNLKLLIFVDILLAQVLRFDLKDFRILENFNFRQCDSINFLLVANFVIC